MHVHGIEEGTAADSRTFPLPPFVHYILRCEVRLFLCEKQASKQNPTAKVCG